MPERLREKDRRRLLSNKTASDTPKEVAFQSLAAATAFNLRNELEKLLAGTDSVETLAEQEPSEMDISPKDPRFTPFREQYESLPEQDRTLQGKVLTWDEVVTAIPDRTNFLEMAASLTEPQVYFLNEEGQLVIGDGCAEADKNQLGRPYLASIMGATRTSYKNEDGETVILRGDKTDVPPGVKILAEREPIRWGEYRRINIGQFDNIHEIWINNGKDATRAAIQSWDADFGHFRGGFTSALKVANPSRGVRSVLRVNLQFGS